MTLWSRLSQIIRCVQQIWHLQQPHIMITGYTTTPPEIITPADIPTAEFATYIKIILDSKVLFHRHA